jgi:hypothetical protein
MSAIEPGSVYWLPESRTFIAAKVGTRRVHGLIIEADGLHHRSLALSETLTPVTYRGAPYPAHLVRRHLKRLKPATATAKALRKEVLA